jgi:hypothetical protein
MPLFEKGKISEKLLMVSGIDQVILDKGFYQFDIIGMLSEKKAYPFGDLVGHADGKLLHLIFGNLAGLQIADISGTGNEDENHQGQGQEDPEVKGVTVSGIDSLKH